MGSEPAVYIVEHEIGVREALELIVESAGIRAIMFDSANAFIASLTGDECGCLLIDFQLTGMSGFEVLGLLKSRNSALMTIIISGHGEIAAAVESMKLGAMDFLQRPLNPDMLLVRIEEALAQSEAVLLGRARTTLGKIRLTALTAREKEILRMLVAGRSSKQIAVESGISLRTVSNHRAHLLAKTGAGNTAELVRMAVEARLIP